MAKWGEGDPRWIVEERADATNVNNWHWTEKNASSWSRDKLTALLSDLTVEDEEGSCKISEITSIEGEATASHRKSKLIFFYEWVLKLEWKGKLKDCKTELKGNIEIPNLSEENDASEVDVIVATKKETSESNILKKIMRKKGIPLIRDQFEKYIKSLKEEFSQGMILPSKNDSPNTTPKTNSSKNALSTSKPTKEEPSTSLASQFKMAEIGVRIHTAKLIDTCHFMCSTQDLYQALTDNKRVEAFTRGPVLMESEIGGRFSLFSGNVTGEFQQLEEGEKIVMRWRLKAWPAGHYSTVTLELHQKPDGAQLNLSQVGVPQNDLETTKVNWHKYYWDSIKATFGYGARLS